MREHLEAADPGLRLLLGVVLRHFRSETESFRPAEASGLNPPGDGAIREHLESDLAAVREGLVLVGELQQALDGDQLAVHFQPILRTSGRDVVGFEALVRWQHPEKGFIPPDRFIPAAEATGVIHPLGEFVAREALRVLAGLRERFEGDYYVSINVAARQVERAGFVEACRGWAEAAGVPPTRLKLEILERSLLTGERARRWIDASRVAGFPLVLDDFGTGFSRLASIHEYRVDALKIDRSFINRIESESGGSMCRAIVSLAQALGIECVAEGVETEFQEKFLVEHGCDELQGYRFSRPISADEIEPLIAQGEKILVFSQFVQMLKILEKDCGTREIATHMLTGETKNRHEVVNTFQETEAACVVLLSLRAAGTAAPPSRFTTPSPSRVT